MIVLVLLFFLLSQNLITLSRSSSPTSSPTRIGEWDISLTNITGNVSFCRSENSVPISTLVYESFPNKLDDLDFSFLDKNCGESNPITAGVVHEISKSYFENKKNLVILVIGVNTKIMTSSSIWNGDGSVSFCIRVDLTGRSVGFDDSVSFHETIINMKYDLRGEFVVENSLKIVEAPMRDIRILVR